MTSKGKLVARKTLHTLLNWDVVKVAHWDQTRIVEKEDAPVYFDLLSTTDTQVSVYSHYYTHKTPHVNSILLCSKRVSVLNTTTLLKK